MRKLLGRVSKEGKKDLKIVPGTLQKAGTGALQDVRHNTFHYASPDPQRTPTSDEKLGQVLAAMSDFGVSFHFDGDTRATTMSFADEASLQFAMGRPTVDADEALRRSEIARDGALAFHRWVDALIVAYIEANKLTVGDAIADREEEAAQGPCLSGAIAPSNWRGQDSPLSALRYPGACHQHPGFRRVNAASREAQHAIDGSASAPRPAMIF